MGHIINSVFVGLCLVLVYFLQYRLRETALARQHGCSLPPRFPLKDPFFGLDYAYMVHTDIPVVVHYHRRCSRTFQVSSISERAVWTIARDNIQTINSSAKDWGVEPLRLPAMETLCGRGFLTTDGSTWQHSRRLLKPIFSKANMIDVSLSSAVNELLGHLPDKGFSGDLQPLLETLVGKNLIHGLTNRTDTDTPQFMHTSIRFLTGLSTLPSEGTLEGPFDVKTFLDAFHDGLFGTGLHLLLGRLAFLAPKAKWLASCEKAHQFLDFYIERALARKHTSEPERSLRGSIIDAKSRSMLESLAEETSSKVEIRSQIIQGMMASQETTSVLISNTLFLLARHTSIWDQLQGEISLAGPELLTYESLSTSKLIHNILLECRLLLLPERLLLTSRVSPALIPSLPIARPRRLNGHHAPNWRRLRGKITDLHIEGDTSWYKLLRPPSRVFGFRCER